MSFFQNNSNLAKKRPLCTPSLRKKSVPETVGTSATITELDPATGQPLVYTSYNKSPSIVSSSVEINKTVETFKKPFDVVTTPMEEVESTETFKDLSRQQTLNASPARDGSVSTITSVSNNGTDQDQPMCDSQGMSFLFCLYILLFTKPTIM